MYYILEKELTPSKTMARLTLAMKYDEHFRNVLALLDTTVERGINIVYIYLFFHIELKLYLYKYTYYVFGVYFN